MRFLLSSAFLFFVGVYSAPAPAAPDNEICSFVNKINPTIFWDRDNILNPSKIAKKAPCVCNNTATPTQVQTTTESVCPADWINFGSSCYWYSNVSSSMSEATENCEGKNATLFVANTGKEWTHITSEKNKNAFNWIGLQKENSETEVQWQAIDGISVSELPLLLKDQEDLAMNGWSDTARCAALFNHALEAGKYVYFYPCTFNFNFICERNATIYHNYPCVNKASRFR